MNKVLALHTEQGAQAPAVFNQKQIDILKNSICKGLGFEEFEVFLMACQKTQLDPFMKQIYAIKRKSRKPDGSYGEVMTIQTGIDGFRLIAERTGQYAPGPEPTYFHDDKGNLQSATAYIKKQTRDGTWHIISASAYMVEFCQKTREGHPQGLWATMPRTMLAKCAEAQALRKAFPAEMSGIYTQEEMMQADNTHNLHVVVEEKVTPEQAQELQMILDDCDPQYKRWVLEYMSKTYHFQNMQEVTVSIYNRMKKAAMEHLEEYRKKQSIEFKPEEFENKEDAQNV